MAKATPAISRLAGQRNPSASSTEEFFNSLVEERNSEVVEGRFRLGRDVRDAARRLARSGRIEICPRGVAVSPDDLSGPVRLRLPR